MVSQLKHPKMVPYTELLVKITAISQVSLSTIRQVLKPQRRVHRLHSQIPTPTVIALSQSQEIADELEPLFDRPSMVNQFCHESKMMVGRITRATNNLKKGVTMKKLLRIVAVSVLGVSLSAGLASAATGTIGTTGPSSNNQIAFTGTTTAAVTNANTAGVTNTNGQTAGSGAANVSGNTTGGSASSGAANNSNSSSTSVSANNSASAVAALSALNGGGSDVGSINNTGPSSNNQVSFNQTRSVIVSNINTASVSNVNSQTAGSGAANVSGNTTGGSATTGGASNTSSSSTSVNFSN